MRQGHMELQKRHPIEDTLSDIGDVLYENRAVRGGMGLVLLPLFIGLNVIKGKEARERVVQRRADHEAGHALIALLRNRPIVDIQISTIQDDTATAIAHITNQYLRTAYILVMERTFMSKTYAIKYIMYLLAGIGAEGIEAPTTLGTCGIKGEEIDDITRAIEALKQLIEGVYGTSSTDEEAMGILGGMFQDLRKFLEEETVKKCHTITSAYIQKERNIITKSNEKKLNPQLLAVLFKAGITPQEWKAVKEKFEKMCVNSRHTEDFVRKKRQATLREKEVDRKPMEALRP